MPISWNEIRQNAIKFSRVWAGATSERAEKQTFWNEFFEVFGIKRRLVATFEEPVKKISGRYGYIDLFWQGRLLVEHKSAGQNLSKAESQAFDYVRQLADEGRLDDIPRYIIVSDFARIALHDLEPEEQRDLPLFDQRRGVTHEFPLADFYRHIHQFAFIAGYKQHTFQEQDPINIEAVQIMGELHDALEAGGYTGHDLQRFLVRILFCLFAQNTSIFEPESFRLFIENRTAPDGSDLGEKLARLFEVLNTPPENRQKNLDETLADFPYVNGDLFNEHLGFADFNRDMRNALLGCTRKDWSRISPAIFGSLFQSIMDDKHRRQIGAHYTSERDILKVVRSLFLDELRAEFQNRKADRSTGRRARLAEFHDNLCKLRFFDPACGCGNFLVIGYREIRQLELETLKEIFGKQTELTLDEITKLSQVDVDQFYGIEIGEWPARIAEVALWLMDHQMNLKVSEAFGQLYQRLPLKKSPHIHCGNALRLDWKTILPPEKCSYVLGNPPFVGKKEQNAEQKADMKLIWQDEDGTGVLDYVTCWYMKAADYIRGSEIRVAFVSTNSISQGEQVGVLWRGLRRRFTLYIHFAHRTFAWESEARGKAHVHVVIIGFAAFDRPDKVIFEYPHSKAEPLKVTAARINPYLADAADVLLFKRGKPLCEVSEISYGSMANDQKRGDDGVGNLILDVEARRKLLAETPELAPFIRPFVGSREFINNIERWCLWLVDAPPQLIRSSPELSRRINSVREWRESSGRAETVRLAATPSLFGEIRQPKSDYLLLPKVSSEERPYLPIGFLPPKVIASGSSLIVPGATRYEFGVLSSAMHMAWMRYTGGRMKSDYQYSSQIVYNNFPWPDATAAQRERVEDKARAVLSTREPHVPPRGLGTLADLYDPLSMPPELVKAHDELDRAVEKCYRADQFRSDRERVELLFLLYEKLTAPLLPATPKPRGRRPRTEPTTPRPARQRTPALPGQNPPPSE
jgi:type I restriction-modification system DNA methylase subunit